MDLYLIFVINTYRAADSVHTYCRHNSLPTTVEAIKFLDTMGYKFDYEDDYLIISEVNPMPKSISDAFVSKEYSGEY